MRDTIPTLVRDVHDSARRIERIIEDLKDFARPAPEELPTALQLNDAVQRALRLLAHLIKKHTDHLHVDLASGLPSVRGDAQHVEQIVVNLVTNALEALPDRRRGVTVTTAFDAAERCVCSRCATKGWGFRRSISARLCDPFFTTKQESGGTGLGLAITSSLVRLHGGRLTFASELGKGTRALVTFPCRPEEPSSSRTLRLLARRADPMTHVLRLAGPVGGRRAAGAAQRQYRAAHLGHGARHHGR